MVQILNKTEKWRLPRVPWMDASDKHNRCWDLPSITWGFHVMWGFSLDAMQRATAMQRAIRITLDQGPSTPEVGCQPGRGIGKSTGKGSPDNMGQDMLRSTVSNLGSSFVSFEQYASRLGFGGPTPLNSTNVALEEPYATQLKRWNSVMQKTTFAL